MGPVTVVFFLTTWSTPSSSVPPALEHDAMAAQHTSELNTPRSLVQFKIKYYILLETF